jgi:hypothetical protein
VNRKLATSIAALGAALLLAPLAAGAQPQAGGNPAGWTAPKTPWGHPDIQGLWPSTEWRGVPLQRAESFGARNVVTEEEFAARERQAAADAAADAEEFAAPSTPDSKPGENPPSYWQDRGKPKMQASLIVEPANGRLPPRTPEAEERVAARQAAAKAHGPADSWESRSLYERCISRGAMNFLPTLYNNGNQILQNEDYVVIRHEMINETRMIPLDGRPFTSIRTYTGESRGRWEGDTLVVETKNYLTSGTVLNGTPVSDDLKVIEKFTRTGDHTLAYEATVDDPRTWTEPWKIAFEITEDPEYPLYEYACHEGNYALVNILMGARAAEAAQRGKP